MYIRNANESVSLWNNLDANLPVDMLVSYGLIPEFEKHANGFRPKFQTDLPEDIYTIVKEHCAFDEALKALNCANEPTEWREMSADQAMEVSKTLSSAILDIEIGVYDELIIDRCVEEVRLFGYVPDDEEIPDTKWPIDRLRHVLINICEIYIRIFANGPVYIFD